MDGLARLWNGLDGGIRAILDRALTVQAQAFSEKARAAIEGAGGTATVVE